MTESDYNILSFFFGFITGFLWFSFKLARNIKQVMKEMGIDQEKIEVKTINPILFTELVNGVILIYDKTSNQFLTQGNTLDEVATKLYENKIKRACIVHIDNGEKTVYLMNEGKIVIEKHESKY